ncbi:hypothetical protein QJU89_02440 [Pasteurella skyensis]|uniref:Uncharacterized protein n=1 Tax=Phocoenobacter skyensis TaxID=97481 RepID=A0AAJ6N8R8_9PAST|nr:hypothetical protein [Pasteurella skyensis]MDP8162367.1 hypothetical protein [Pasteurella skyensis]MDP8172299.1 hypothetical protein [Pasteurella skyensis]MDP8178554.1 hypothetical protein [Pasteurella skyensis]MDP8182556.1 hypothetical protein [Pasteurella skyensis]MDP8188861.1 hypothetical protein [Pasteurella skyensis]
MNKITAISKSKTINYGDQQIHNIWTLKNEENYDSVSKEIIYQLSGVYSGTICIQTNKLSDPNLIKILFDKSQNPNIKVYILTHQYNKELEQLKGHCLIRLGVPSKASIVLINPNMRDKEAVFFSGEFTEQSLAYPKHLSCNLNDEQIAEIYRHFCYQFWEQAQQEIIDKGEAKECSNNKPFDIFHNPNEYGNNKDFIFGTVCNFSDSITRNEIADYPFFILGKETAGTDNILEYSVKKLGHQTASYLLNKNEFESFEPVMNDDGTSVSVTYEWQNIPFYLPNHSKNHPLYEKWDKKTADIRKTIGQLTNKIIEQQKQESNLKKIARFFMGKNQKFKEILLEIDNISEQDFANLSTETLQKYIDKLNSLNQQSEAHIVEIKNEHKKAQLTEEIEELEHAKTTKQDEENKKRSEIDLVETKKTPLDSKISQLRKQQSELQKQKSDLEKDIKKNSKKDNKDDLNKLNKQLEELSTQLGTIQKDVSEKEKTQKELGIKLNKLKNELSSIQQSIRNLDRDINAKKTEISKIGMSKDDSSSLATFNKNKPNNIDLITMPNTKEYPQLPQIGTLYQVGSESYLAIEYWEEYEQGSNEAKRLNAKLCAIKE